MSLFLKIISLYNPTIFCHSVPQITREHANSEAITCINADLLSIGPLTTNFSEIRIKIKKICNKNAFENSVCEMAAILFREKWVGWRSRRTLPVQEARIVKLVRNHS